MIKMVRCLKATLLAVPLLMVILTCANERPITGGPEDKEAPQIIFSLPENEAVNVDPKTEILIKFNEQMKKTTFSSSLQIWPRPPGGYELKSSWKWLKIKFNEPLDSNETYLLTLDKGVQDLRGNGLAATHVMAFSTGKDLNNGRLMGTIAGSKAIRKNGDLFLYRQFDTDLSELRKLNADYVFQPDDQGNFELPYLAERAYMLFYHWDRNQNKLIDGDDYFGRPEVATVWARSDSITDIHKIWPQVVPMASMRLLGITSLADQFIQVRTSRMVTEQALASIELFADDIKVPVLGASTVKEDDFAMLLDLAVPLKENSRVWLRSFQDTSGYLLNSDTLLMRATSDFDTLELGKIQVDWLEKEMTLLEGEKIIRLSSDIPVVLRSDSAFMLIDQAVDSIQIPGLLEKQNSMAWTFKPDSILADGSTFKWEINTQFIYAPLNGRKLDSLMTGRLKLMSQDSLGSLKILHMGGNTLNCRLRGKGIDRAFKLEPSDPVIIDGLPAQTYSLVAFIDENGDGRYQSGGMGPAAKSEPFRFYPDQIKIRARWETDLGVWRIND